MAMRPTCQPSSPPSLSFFSPLPHPPLFCAAAEAAGTGGRRCLTAKPSQGRRPDQPAPATAPSHRLGHVSAMREPSRRAARGLAGHHDERCALYPRPLLPSSPLPHLLRVDASRFPLHSSSLPEPSRAPLGAQRASASRGARSAHTRGARAARRLGAAAGGGRRPGG